MADGALIVQSDRSVLLEVDHPKADAARAAIAPFAELEKSPEHVHTYRLTPLALWNARAAGLTPAQVTDALREHSRYPVPPGLLTDLVETMGRYGRLVLRAGEDGIELASSDPAVLEEVVRSRKVAPHLGERLGPDRVAVPLAERGRLKQALLALGWPADDQAGYVEGAALPIELLAAHAGTGERFGLRRYQRESVTAFAAAGSGVIVLPCGAGKTLVGLGAMAAVGARTLILVTTTLAARQWREELLARTDLQPAQVGEYSGARKEIAPVTIATYQILITRRGGRHTHLDLLGARGLGPDHLRRGPPAAGAGVPHDGRDPGPAAAGPDRHPGPRGRPRGRRVQPDRPQAVRRALAGPGGAGVDRGRRLRRGPGRP